MWKLGEILQTIEQSKIFRDFFDSERSKASQKRTKQARVKTPKRFYTASTLSAPSGLLPGMGGVHQIADEGGRRQLRQKRSVADDLCTAQNGAIHLVFLKSPGRKVW